MLAHDLVVPDLLNSKRNIIVEKERVLVGSCGTWTGIYEQARIRHWMVVWVGGGMAG